VNGQLLPLFESGDVAEALIGSDRISLPDHTWRLHDRPLVIRELLRWAAITKREADARDGFAAALHSLDERGADADLLDLIWSYLLVTHETVTLPLASAAELRSVLDRAVERNGGPVFKSPMSPLPSDDVVRLILGELRAREAS